MSKSTKQTDAPKSKEKKNYVGLVLLTFALTELASTYVFATQDNKVLWGLGAILLVDGAYRLGRMAVK